MPKEITVKSVLNKKKAADSWFLDQYTLNPYSACSFNCLFCYTQGSKYGNNMADKVSVKSNALEVLEKQLALRAKKNEYGFIVLASATDPYLHFEKDLKLTRGMLELILKYRFPVHVLTRSNLIERDFDLLHQINKESKIPEYLRGKINNATLITFSFSCIEQKIADIFEPGATSIENRLATLRCSAENGFKTGVSLMPLLPFISDTGEQLHKTFVTLKEQGTEYLLPSTLTLFGNERGDSKWLVYRAIEKHYPHLIEKYKKFFDNSDYMPAYYNNAFNKKIKELCDQYGIRNSII